jgi:hypothetical protein
MCPPDGVQLHREPSGDGAGLIVSAVDKAPAGPRPADEAFDGVHGLSMADEEQPDLHRPITPCLSPRRHVTALDRTATRGMRARPVLVDRFGSPAANKELSRCCAAQLRVGRTISHTVPLALQLMC